MTLARSATPIIIRIPKWRYPDYGIQSERPFEFWRESISFEAFVKQIRDGIEKKLVEYKNSENSPGEIPIAGSQEFESKQRFAVPEIISYRYLKSVSKPIAIKGERQQAIGSLREFEFSPQCEEESNNLEFALDSGFGERNSLGFGFMNLVRQPYIPTLTSKSGMSTKMLEMDQKGRIHIPKEMRDKLGIKPGPVTGKIAGQTLLIEPPSNIFDRLASLTKCNFQSVENSLPRLRRAAERQLMREIKQ